MNSRVELAAIYLVLSYVSREYYKALREVARDCVASESRERVRGDHGEYSNSLALARFFHSRGFMRGYMYMRMYYTVVGVRACICSPEIKE